MGNCDAREEAAVISPAQVQTGSSDKKHNRAVSDLAVPSTPRSDDSKQNVVVPHTQVITFTLYELETVSESFRPDYILGEGGFGTVYKGYIDENARVGLKPHPVAVKVLNKEGPQGHCEWHLLSLFINSIGFYFCMRF